MEESKLAAELEPVVQARNPFPVALAVWATATGCPGDARWKVSINVHVKPDL